MNKPIGRHDGGIGFVTNRTLWRILRMILPTHDNLASSRYAVSISHKYFFKLTCG